MTTRVVQGVTDDQTLHLPRILCLHGGGSNAQVFRAQCRILTLKMKSHFRLVFADGPFLSQPGPCVMSVYADCGPFRRWLRWTSDDAEISPTSAVEAIENSLWRAMGEDDERGAAGEWVAVLGFSQGAKIAASLLFRQQTRVQKLDWAEQRNTRTTNFRFAVLLAGRGPLISLDPDLLMTPALHDASAISVDDHDVIIEAGRSDHVLRLPTIHLHGLRDPGLDLHRRLLERYCEKDSASLLEWDGEHRVPIKSADVDPLVARIMELSRVVGVF